MITEFNTVFILGAGASCPYGFPTAVGLKNFICKDYSGFQGFNEPLRDREKEINKYHSISMTTREIK